MLTSLRENSKSLVMTIFFGAIIAVFVLNFGPGSGSASCASLSSDIYAAKIMGRSITKEELQEAQLAFSRPGTHEAMSIVTMQALYGQFTGGAQRDPSLDLVVFRELLANQAEEIGFAVTDDQIDIEILQPTLPGRTAFVDQNGRYDNDAFEAYVSLTLNVSMKEYRESVRRYLLAQKMADFLMSQVKVSDDEVLFEYKLDKTTAELEFVKFFTAKYTDQATISDDEAKTYADAHTDEVKKYYDEHQDIYGEQVRARHILRKVSDAVTDDDAKQEIDRLHKLVTRKEVVTTQDPVTKKEVVTTKDADFAQFAAENSEDGSASKGGDLGWAPPTNYVKEFKEACIALKPGEISEPIKTQFGYHIIKMEEKKLAKTIDEVKVEIAKELAKESKKKELAKADAEKYLALAKALAATDSIEKVIPSEAPAPAPTSAPTSVPALAPTTNPTTAPTSAPASEPASAPAPVDPYALKVLTASFNMAQASVGNIDPLGSSKEIALATFLLAKDKPQLEKVYEVGDAFVIARLKSRTEADIAKFETPEGKTEFDELKANALNIKQAQFLAEWLTNERKKLLDRGDIVTYAIKPKVQQ